MHQLSQASDHLLSTCDKDLQLLFRTVIKYRDFSVPEAYRGKEAQTKLLSKKLTKRSFPHSAHNVLPSRGIDVAPLPLKWQDILAFREFCHFVKGVAAGLGIEVINGGIDWEPFLAKKQDPAKCLNCHGEDGRDWCHWEIKS